MTNSALVYPGVCVRNHDVARWVRKNDVGVQVRASAELGAVISAGVHPARVIVHASGVSAADMVFCSASLGVGCIVVDTFETVDVLARALRARRHQTVLVDVVDGDSDDDTIAVVRAVLAQPRLNIVGLHTDIGTTPADFVSYPAAIGDLICRMSRIRQSEKWLLTRLALTGVVYTDDEYVAEVSRHSPAIEQSLDDACLTLGFPRPSVIVAASMPSTDMHAA
ncbi:hypothetical protein [Mycolicibacterium obuense]|uniref:hypothetical protein n=1 Tax=Mycolicibacterium obuense TaxID=1807 RepID=UPI00069AA4E2|nr:hypothetical protein [Mycolicibacterium obuense]